MPEKIERCVKEVMEKQNLPEERAWAICTAAMKDGITYDRDNIFSSKIDKDTGFLTLNVNLARTGVQHYRGYELGLMDRANDLIGVFRSPDEVFGNKSIDSFVNLVVTNDHPLELVTVDNVKKLQKGQVSDVKQKADFLSGIVTLTDKDQIKQAQNGKIEVSVGYTNDLIPETGKYKGIPYEFKQTNIKANHLAIVDKARCGNDCKLTTDNKGAKTMPTVTIDGVSYEVESALASSIAQMQKTHDQEKKMMKKKMEEQEEEMEEKEKENEKMKKDHDAAVAQKDALEKKQLSDEAFNKLVSERAELLTTARTILGDKLPDCVDCPTEMKIAVIDHVIPDMALEDKSDDYISAAYDMAVKEYQKAKTSMDNLRDDFKTKTTDSVTRDSIREKYIEETLNLTR
jgi:hypothetical protein